MKRSHNGSEVFVVLLQANSKKSNPKNVPVDDIPIDDEDAEGSGFEESRSDLESSGSGYGPDDEDADRGSGPFGSELQNFVESTVTV